VGESMVNFHIHQFQPGGAVGALQARFAHARALFQDPELLPRVPL
jgi:hypothetical protein